MSGKLVCDTEVYKNYFLVMFRNIETGNTKYFHRFNDSEFDGATVMKILCNNTIITFNGNNYDMPILMLACKGASNAEIKKMSDRIIVGNLKGWMAAQEFKVEVPSRIDHIDLFEVAPGVASLKIYGGRLHVKKMQDLPIDPSAEISLDDAENLMAYCGNDLVATLALYNCLKPQIELRAAMKDTYDLDLRSKSDAQIAEAIIKSRLQIETGITPKRPEIESGTKYQYRAPNFISFASDELKETLALVERSEFFVADSGKLIMPKELASKTISVGAGQYRMGIGGLHSTESRVAYRSDEEFIIVDRDVSSYYPAIILTCGLYPKHLGRNFLGVYRSLVQKRLEAKRKGDKVTSDTLKIVANGSFGKFGSKWSALYSPDLLIQTTITGQLALLMLIEMVSPIADVVSANTDGVVIHCRRIVQQQLNEIVSAWEMITGFETEETQYEAYYGRDVNNYIALKKGGLVKLKGAYSPPVPLFGSWPNPSNEICVDAVLNFLVLGIAIEDTIMNCDDIRQFISIRAVKGGALHEGKYLGKAVRWYYGRGVTGAIHYKSNGYTVARTEGAVPCMELPDELPSDIDYEWYVKEALSILVDVGFSIC